MLAPADWQASWIEPDWDEDPASFHPCPYLRTTFFAREQAIAARVYITAHGFYDLSLNGQRVGDAYFTPGYTIYHHRLQYQVYDVSMVQVGENALGVILGDGWYRGSIGMRSHRNVYGHRLGLFLQLHVIFADGSEQVVTSDRQWQATTGPILRSDLKEGEIYDARLEMPGWNQVNFDTSAWQGVRIAEYSLENLITTPGPVVRRKEHFVPVQVLHTPAGETVVDMGQNFSGVVQLKVHGPAGTAIRLCHGEALDKHGNFTMDQSDTRRLRSMRWAILPPAIWKESRRHTNCISGIPVTTGESGLSLATLCKMYCIASGLPKFASFSVYHTLSPPILPIRPNCWPRLHLCWAKRKMNVHTAPSISGSKQPILPSLWKIMAV